MSLPSMAETHSLPPVAVLKNLSLYHGKTQALHDLSLTLPAGKMVGIIGPDGVGKSSLFSVLSGAHAIQSGDAEVLGGDMRNRKHRQSLCPRIAYMPQGLGKNLYPTLSVYENIDFLGDYLVLEKRTARCELTNYWWRLTCWLLPTVPPVALRWDATKTGSVLRVDP